MAQQFHCVSLCVFQRPVASRRASEISNHARHSTLQIARASMRVSVEFSLRFRRFSSLDYGALRNFNPKQRALATVSCFFSDGFPYFPRPSPTRVETETSSWQPANTQCLLHFFMSPADPCDGGLLLHSLTCQFLH